MMNIHLSRPGGQREGPFTLEEINRDLAANKFRETDYWAWYEGLTEWVPLHQVPGIVRSRAAEPPEGRPNRDVPEYKAGDTEVIYHEDSEPEEATGQGATAEQETSEEPESAQPEPQNLKLKKLERKNQRQNRLALKRVSLRKRRLVLNRWRLSKSRYLRSRPPTTRPKNPRKKP